MRARRLTLALVLTVTAAVPAGAAAAPVDQVVGRVASAAPEVDGTMPDRPPGRLLERAPVFLGMEVATRVKAAARIELGERGKPFFGALRMGEKSKVRFVTWVEQQVIGGKRPEATFLAQVGEFLFFLMPRPRGVVAGDVKIETPTGDVRLHGTAVYLRVSPDGTTLVAVLEGAVTVTGRAGREIDIRQGSWTELAPGRPPRPPSPLTGIESPEAGGPAGQAFLGPGDHLILDPPRLDVEGLIRQTLILDLPKAGRP